MKLATEQLVLDTNILVHWLRGKDAGEKLRADYDLGGRRPRPIVPVVVKGEIKSFAFNNLMHPLILAAHSRPKTARRSSCSRRHAS